MKYARFFLLSICLFTTPALHAQTRDLSSTGELLDAIIAIVNDGIVLQSELELEMQRIVTRLNSQGTPVPPVDTLASQVLERLVIARIQLQRADQVGIRISDETLNLALSNVAARNNLSLTDLPSMLASEGIDYRQYRLEMRDQLAIEQLRQRDVMSRINVSPRELDEYLERQEGRAFTNDEFRLAHILISTSVSASEADIVAAEQKVDDIYQRALGGESFAELAVANSDGQSALEGGDMGWRKGDELPTLFADFVPGLLVGQVGEPVRSASGYHIVKLTEKRGSDPILQNQTRARHILITTNEILDDEAALQKLMEIREQIVDGDSFEAVAKAVSEDPGSAIEGGDLGWNGPGAFVPIFQDTCDALDVDEISEPFKSPFGWHIVQLLERRVHDTTDEVRSQEAIMAIRNSKLTEETEIWMRRLRDQAFVENRL
jgi:peptidyl-prolyl cis-trans isomerase SurA